jgi:hypothetical protein
MVVVTIMLELVMMEVQVVVMPEQPLECQVLE